ncbi:unnamed protein product [marine sediment metagenome]
MDQESPTNPNPCPLKMPPDHCPKCGFYLDNRCCYPQLILFFSIWPSDLACVAYAPITKKQGSKPSSDPLG